MKQFKKKTTLQPMKTAFWEKWALSFKTKLQHFLRNNILEQAKLTEELIIWSVLPR